MVRISNLKQSLGMALQRAGAIDDRVADIFYSIGIDAVKKARIEADYLNHTNNLRSSYGLIVSVNGDIKKYDFELRGDGKDGDGKEGLARAEVFADRIKNDFPDGVALIIVAGERYAGWVENKGRQVLSGFARKASNDLVKQLKRFTENG